MGDARQNVLSNDELDSDIVCVPEPFFRKHTSKPYVEGMEEYQVLYEESIRDPEAFWAKQARELLSFERDFDTIHTGSIANGDNAWFLGGKLNASFNCIDRHVSHDPKKPAIIFEADEPGEGRTLTYGDMLREVSRLAWVLKSRGVRKGDTVAIYMPVIPEAIVAILACVRIGAVHSVVFGGFSATSLRDRILDAQCKVVITADEGKRGGKTVHLKKIVDDALSLCLDTTSVIVFKHTGSPIPWTEGRDIWWQEEASRFPAYLAPESMDSEDPLFLLYTSGSTGKPKGLMHTTAGFLLGAAITGKYVLDIHPEDRYFCTADFGWITGHTYVAYAPLLLGTTIVVYEGTPNYPNFSRYWDIIEENKVTHFYTAPTALRLLKRAGDEHIHHNMEHLRVIACVGEPIAAEVWKWVYETVGKRQAHVVDTFFQTETGAHILSPLGGVTPTKPGSATLPFFGVELAILDPVSGEELSGNSVEGVLVAKYPWPSMARTVWGAHQRYMDTYLNVYPGYYFTGDGAGRDKDGYYWIRGRVDDVVNVSGHRLSTAEIEAALLEHPKVSEAAVIGVADDLTGQAVNAFVALKPDCVVDDGELTKHVRTTIGAFAAPRIIFVVVDLPKTRSGKIMRRILRKIVSGEDDSLGDTSTLSNPGVIDKIIATVYAWRKQIAE
ncbi:acetate--CoA ligase [Aspergillus alliaceus]|uniref:acetate--CoA ligase n=1 Tax=Petromyces alliaceus TaxID=209559 RepID=UPI0012A72676|nr:acetyl-coenzyme A synthetase FacA [Aspergillus alliaceus]KAB8235860.1 acetyl-coenzyme A synthetase FacA [Aspergillus alliaceus]